MSFRNKSLAKDKNYSSIQQTVADLFKELSLSKQFLNAKAEFFSLSSTTSQIVTQTIL